MAEEQKEKMPPSCAGCMFWERHGKSCWYFWEQKKDCTMHSDRQANF